MSSGLADLYGMMCCICWAPVTLKNAWRDENGQAWDICSQECADQTRLHAPH